MHCSKGKVISARPLEQCVLTGVTEKTRLKTFLLQQSCPEQSGLCGGIQHIEAISMLCGFDGIDALNKIAVEKI
jgi:hypothetical protein